MKEANELDFMCGISDEELTERFKEGIRIENEIKRLKGAPIAGYDRERKQAYKEVTHMPRIVPIKDLRNTNEISRLCHEKMEPVFVTKQGYGDLVVMSVETYDQIVGIAGLDAAIASSEAELAAGGKLREAGEALGELRKKHFG